MPSKKNTKYLSLLVLFFTFSFGFSQNTSKFKVVLDAGHGGEDPGAIKNGIKDTPFFPKCNHLYQQNT